MAPYHLLRALLSIALITGCASFAHDAPADIPGLIARAANPPGAGPTPTVMPIEKREQIIFNWCPEQVGQAKQSCDDDACGGDTKQGGFCDNIRISGPQDGRCAPPGCGSYCQCTPQSWETPVPTDQIPFQVCPEALGDPKKKCSDCGGDSKSAGVCNNILLNGDQQGCPPGGCGYYCQCDDGSGSTNPTSTVPPSGGPTNLVTSIVNGETITATFQATTLSEWKDLRSHTTITTSVSNQETEIAVAIFAGGVAWWLLGQSGAAAAVLNAPGDPPEGSEEDDQQCSPEPQCEDNSCGGANDLGLCKSGDKANCPCEEDQKECPSDPPKCTDTECGGDNGNSQCKGDGKLEGCQCCPDEQPQCASQDCDGKDGKCEAEKLKGCSCSDFVTGPAPVPQPLPFSPSQSEIDDTAWEIFQTLFDGDQSILGGEENRTHPSDSPTCSDNSASGVPAQMVTDGGNKSPNELQYLMREVLCNDQCQDPAGIPTNSMAATPDADGCEIAIILPNDIEAYSYRGTHSQGPQWQDCWDSLANITETCIKNAPNTGWVNGPDEYEFFQAGFRPLNDPGAKHGQLDGNNALKDANASPPAQTSSSTAPAPTDDPDCPAVPPCPAGKGCLDPKPCDQLSCNTDCCGMVPNPAWCNIHCGGMSC